jgi:hypothetical protein
MGGLMKKLILFILLLMTSSAFATTIHVPTQQPTIQAGINAANSGDTVLVACATYTWMSEGTGTANGLIQMKSGVVLRSETGNSSCAIIDAQGMGRVFYCINLAEGTIIEGFTIINGFATGNYPFGYGGGMFCENCVLTISNCNFVENIALYAGGGIHSESSSLDISFSGFSANIAQNSYGGGVVCDGIGPYPLNVTDCLFFNNHALDDGGGMLLFTAPAYITSCYFLGNTTEGNSGGLGCRGPDYTIVDCTFSGNDAGYDGAGFGGFGFTNSSFTGCTFVYNTVYAPLAEGGGIYCGNDSYFTIMDCTFSDNSAPKGGGIALGWDTDPSNADIENTIIAFSYQGEAIYCAPNCSAFLTCCDVYGNAGGDYVGCIAGQGCINGNIPSDPLFCGVDAPPGDPWDTPFMLHAHSPCAPGNNSCGVRIGSKDVGCEGLPPKLVDQEQTLWWDTAFVDLVLWDPGQVQSFVPTVDRLDAVQVLLAANYSDPTYCVACIYDVFPQGMVAPMACDTMPICPPIVLTAPEWFQFHFDDPVPLVPGGEYYLTMKELTYQWNVHWYFYYEVPMDAYPPGTAWLCTAPYTIVPPTTQGYQYPFDFAFKTEYYQGYICGDANGDGIVNVSDAVYIINYVFVGGPVPDPYASGDANCDDVVNVSDAVWIINYVFVGGNIPCDTVPTTPNGDGIPDC